MAIVLVRHAQTDGNARRVLQHPDAPLSELGRAQARRLGRRLSATLVARIVSSDYARARETAEAIGQACGVAVGLDPVLRERSFGELRGRAYAGLGLDPFAPDFVPPGGESWADLHARVDRAWEAIAPSALGLDGDLVVVTHGLVYHSLVTRRLDLLEHGPAPGSFGNTALSIVDVEPPWRVRLLGCTSHLGSGGP